ncbi:S-layer homology domain-containing protein [Citricoccus sp. SGAir0253]|uniref:S-layer homology domain-containing protein n=1 Tax=Citricoccus sp. SGAir0253 TaxID=2567881 RepID=UPI00143DAFF5|nr:S-layer homology domain-containing protein [Citricoccus sp. SGAir0253]
MISLTSVASPLRVALVGLALVLSAQGAAAAPPAPAGPSSGPAGDERSEAGSLTSEPVPLTVDGVDAADLPVLPSPVRAPRGDEAPRTPATLPPPPAAACEAIAFPDVPAGSTFHAHVSWLACERLATGYGDGTFGAARRMTRAEAALVLYRLSGETHEAGDTVVFHDVPRSSAAFTAVSWMRSRGYATGYANGSFGYGRDVSRGELAAFLYRMAGASHPVTAYSAFVDMTPRTPFFREAAWLQSTGIVTGYADRSFRPTRGISRGEAATFLYSFAQVRDGTRPVPAVDRWTTVATGLHATADPRTPATHTLPAQTGVLRLAEQDGMTRVRTGSTSGWVNTDFLSRGRPGTTEVPYPGTRSLTGRAANTMAPWCWDVPMTTFDGATAWARYRWSGDPDWPSSLRIRELIGLGDDLDPDFVPARAMQLHECAHILQFRAYRYDEGALVSAMERLYPGGPAGGVEHMADCMADAMGAQRVHTSGGRTWTAGYGGTCTMAQRAAARKVIAGLRP